MGVGRAPKRVRAAALSAPKESAPGRAAHCSPRLCGGGSPYGGYLLPDFAAPPPGGKAHLAPGEESEKPFPFIVYPCLESFINYSFFNCGGKTAGGKSAPRKSRGGFSKKAVEKAVEKWKAVESGGAKRAEILRRRRSFAHERGEPARGGQSGLDAAPGEGRGALLFDVPGRAGGCGPPSAAAGSL